MSCINESDWLSINQIIYLINAVTEDEERRKRVLVYLRQLIPYNNACFYLADKNKGNMLTNPVSIDCPDRKIQQYDQHYYKVDYSRKLYYQIMSSVYRETDIFEKSKRERSEYYNDYLQSMHYVVNCNFANLTGLLGSMSLNRTKEEGEFSERELFMLRILEPHLTNRLSREQQKGYLKLVDNNYLIKNYKLTNREIEIMDLVSSGLSNIEISNYLFISLGTVKKHLNNIFRKTEVNSRSKLISQFTKEIYKKEA